MQSRQAESKNTENPDNQSARTRPKGTYLGEIQAYFLLFTLAVVAYLIPMEQLSSQIRLIVQIAIVAMLISIIALYVTKRR
jgi:hypothetical protein